MKTAKALIRVRDGVHDEWRYKLVSTESYVYGVLKVKGGKHFTNTYSMTKHWELLCDDQPTEVLLTMLELTKNGEAK